MAVSDPPATPFQVSPFQVNVVRSARRKKTVAATLTDGVLTVTVPSWMKQPDIDRWTTEMARRFGRQTRSREIDLPARAARLAKRYDLPAPDTIRWVDNMASRWASCTMDDRAVRVSRRLANYPAFVVDAVIVHELCHLVVPNHSAAFWKLMERYPLNERATGYLMAKAQDRDDLPPVPEEAEAATTRAGPDRLTLF